MAKCIITLVFSFFLVLAQGEPPKPKAHKNVVRKVKNTVAIPDESGKIRVFNLHGELCLRSRKKKVDFSNLPNGFYIIQTKTIAEVVQKID